MADPKITIKVEGSGLPQGGSDGQVLTRQDGKAVWGDALPKGSTPHQQLVTDANGVAKWEDRLAYSGIEVGSELFPEAEVNFNIDLGDGIVQASIDGDYDEILPGHIYKVTINGKSYTCQAYGGTVDVYTVGQIGAMPDEEYSESMPFAIYTHTQFAGDIMMVTRSDLLPNPSTIRIVEVEETVKPIDPKYIPKETIATITHNSYNSYTIVEGEGASREQICNAIKEGKRAFLRCDEWKGMLSYSHQILSNGTYYPNGTMAFFNGVVDYGSTDNAEVSFLMFAMLIADENGNIPAGDFIGYDYSVHILEGNLPQSSSGVVAYSHKRAFGVDWNSVPDRLPTTVPVIRSAQVGQTIVVKAVDENGKPTEWECADVIIPSSTEGSAKRFKLTVDDSGTITATEVT